ncbi:hypothetical protein CPB83DRAFT_893868 [Crepidotus variabilis]|uniref:DUF6534 domain-containing protein n=1 Tax=Crepidotus variabilis TaxID=179855 RepID=A0A9P6JQM2_9AGAR|nr:hypothetical protein CPB83DRAFT_893868 [Crepidotus variabilis]
MSAVPAIPHNLIEGNHGALFIGLLVATILYGVACAQTVVYFHRWGKDRRLFKNVVLVLWILNTISLLQAVLTLDGWLITNFGNFMAILQPSTTALIQMFLSGFADVVVRRQVFFFARRAFILLKGLGKSRVVPWAVASIIVILSVFMYIEGITLACIGFRVQSQSTVDISARMAKYVWMDYAYNGISALVDCIIASSLCYALTKSRSGFNQTNHLVIQLMTFSISSGFVTSIFAISSLIVYAIFPQYLIALSLAWVIGQLHFNSLLLSLNSRSILRERYGDLSDSGGFSHEAVSFPGRMSTQYAIPLKEAHAQISVSKEVTISSS